MPAAVERRQVRIRFKHVDGAGIVFYPRYFEMLAAFPVASQNNSPFGLEVEFRRPNRLGDDVTLTLSRQDQDQDQDRDIMLRLLGELDGHEHFSLSVLRIGEPPPMPDLAGAGAILSDTKIGDALTSVSGSLQLSRYFEMVSDNVELWLETQLGESLAALQNERSIGIPTVRFSTLCKRLPDAGENVQTYVLPMRLGHKSLALRHLLCVGDECLVQNDQVIVFVRMANNGFSSIGIPADIAKKIRKLTHVAT